jgi:cyclopropane fatty-acyl-phospholipid synthase-like methyltransferase
MRSRSAFVLVLILALAAGCASRTAPGLRPPDVHYVPTPPEVVDGMLKLAGVTSSDVVYDLGCGDGRIPVTAARQYGAQGVCIDIDPDRVAEANANVDSAGVRDKVKVLNADLFEVDLAPASVVTLYLLPSLNEKLMPKLQRELRPGSRIVSHAFDMGDAWPPEQMEDIDGTQIYLWTIK